MQKLISLAMIVILCGSFTINSFAYVDVNGEVFEFENHDGSITKYYVDKDGYEYTYKNGEKIFVLLPLEKYRVSDTKLIELQNSNIYPEEYSSAPTISRAS